MRRANFPETMVTELQTQLAGIEAMRQGMLREFGPGVATRHRR